jgi:outer membrane receptor protein involved in Fe transport
VKKYCRPRLTRRDSPRTSTRRLRPRHTCRCSFGGRVENARFRPEADEPDRDFTNVSGSLGLLLLPSDSTTVAFSLARASRNPALEELYFHGPHAGNNAFENGDPNLESEHATGFDASFRWRGAAASGEVTYFFNRIDGSTTSSSDS